MPPICGQLLVRPLWGDPSFCITATQGNQRRMKPAKDWKPAERTDGRIHREKLKRCTTMRVILSMGWSRLPVTEKLTWIIMGITGQIGHSPGFIWQQYLKMATTKSLPSDDRRPESTLPFIRHQERTAHLDFKYPECHASA